MNFVKVLLTVLFYGNITPLLAKPTRSRNATYDGNITRDTSRRGAPLPLSDVPSVLVKDMLQPPPADLSLFRRGFDIGGQGWTTNVELLHMFDPIQPAARALEQYYEAVLEQIELHTGNAPQGRLCLSARGMCMGIRCLGGRLEWELVRVAVRAMLEATQGGFAGEFRSEWQHHASGVVIQVGLVIIDDTVKRIMSVPAPLDLKKTATDFSSAASSSNWSSPLILPERILRSWTGPSKLDIDKRYLFARELGSGREGTVRLYNDTRTGRAVAVKTFHSQPRNRLPERLIGAIQEVSLITWPAEIPATLIFGNSRLETHDEQLFSKHRLPNHRLDIVPALDYFTTSSQGKRWNQSKWQLVLPYLGPDIRHSKGTLSDFALYLKKERRTPEQLDIALRPGLYRVLGTLGLMHDKNFCHNDMKPDNLYVQKQDNWLVGDLGNVREINHPYYQSKQWALEGQWSDCAHNDVRRTIIAYLVTIRRAAADHVAFDDQFFCGETFLSRLYWEFMRHPVAAKELHSRLEQNLTGITGVDLPHCSKNEPTTMMIDLMHLQRPLLTRSVDKELRWSTPPSRWRVWISNWGF